jgi:hypothetical protein
MSATPMLTACSQKPASKRVSGYSAFEWRFNQSITPD